MSSIAVEQVRWDVRDALRVIAGRAPDRSVKGSLAWAARAIGTSYARARSLYYGEARTLHYVEVRTALAVAEQIRAEADRALEHAASLRAQIAAALEDCDADVAGPAMAAVLREARRDLVGAPQAGERDDGALPAALTASPFGEGGEW